MNNFYELFEVSPKASEREILMSYENKITKFNNLKTELTKEEIYEIKRLKIGLHVLTNRNLREKYNNIMKINKNVNLESKEPVAVNLTDNQSLDSVFKVDNEWMKSVKVKTKNDNKISLETNIGDRIFSLSDFNKRPGYSSDFEASLRRPQQGREDKTHEVINESFASSGVN